MCVKLVTLMFLLMVVVGCAEKFYQICDDAACRTANATEAIQAADVHKEWGKDSTLKLRINKERK